MAVENKKLKEFQIIYETDKLYYTFLSVKAKVKLALEYQKLLEELVNVVEDSYQTGMTNRNELLKVKVKYNEASLQVQQAQTGLELTRMSLCRIIGADLNTYLEINDSISTVNFDAEGITKAIASERVEYQLMQNQLKLTEQNIKIVRGDYMPTAGVSVGYNYFLLGLQDQENYDQHGFNAIASIKIPITNFGERKGKITAAKADYNIRQLELQQAEGFLQLEIEQARLTYVDAFSRVKMTAEAVEQASENMRISDDNYSLGMETIVNLLEAKAQWQQAYTNNIDALANFKIKESNLLRVANELSFD